MARRVPSAAFPLIIALVVAGCDAQDSNGSVSISMNSDAGAGNVSIEVPGFNAKIDVPSSLMDHGNFDIDGVKLYPGSKVTSFNVDANTGSKGSKTDAIVKIGYNAPAEAPAVKTWFLDAFKAEAVKVAETATGVSGTSSDGDDFTMTFAPAEAGHSTGTITVTDKGSD